MASLRRPIEITTEAVAAKVQTGPSGSELDNLSMDTKFKEGLPSNKEVYLWQVVYDNLFCSYIYRDKKYVKVFHYQLLTIIKELLQHYGKIHKSIGAAIQSPPQPKKRKVVKSKSFVVENQVQNGEQIIVITFANDEKIEVKQNQIADLIRSLIKASVEAHKKSLLQLLQQ